MKLITYISIFILTLNVYGKNEYIPDKINSQMDIVIVYDGRSDQIMKMMSKSIKKGSVIYIGHSGNSFNVIAKTITELEKKHKFKASSIYILGFSAFGPRAGKFAFENSLKISGLILANAASPSTATIKNCKKEKFPILQIYSKGDQIGGGRSAEDLTKQLKESGMLLTVHVAKKGHFSPLTSESSAIYKWIDSFKKDKQ